MIVVQSGLLTDSLVYIRSCQKLLPSLPACTITQRWFKIIGGLFKARLQLPFSLAAQIEFKGILLTHWPLSADLLNHLHGQPLLNENMFDRLVFDVNTVIEDSRSKKDPLQKLSVPDTIIQSIHRAGLVVVRAVVGSRITVYQLHFFKCGMTRYKNDHFFIWWNGIQESLTLSISIVESNF